jgi:diaminopimelate decarboxylase
VIYVKRTKVKNFVVVDGGMNDLIRPALYGAYHEVWPLVKRSGKRVKSDVVGPICESGDFLAKDRRLQLLESGDLLALLGAGAYGFSMSSNYNSRPRPPEVMGRGKRFDIVRKREDYEDLIRNERIPNFLQ